MSSSTTPMEIDQDISEEHIAEYLLAHPNFFARHTRLLETLYLPHDSGDAISLIEHQVAILRQKNQQLDDKLLDLIHTARDNEQLVLRMHRLSMVLIEAEDLSDVLAVSRDLLLQDFKADYVTLLLADGREDSENLNKVPKAELTEMFSNIFEARRALCGGLTESQLQYLFGADGVHVGSSVLVPLYDAEVVGVLALGSRDESRFHPSMGTLFLGYLGDLVSKAITHHKKNDLL